MTRGVVFFDTDGTLVPATGSGQHQAVEGPDLRVVITPLEAWLAAVSQEAES